MCMCMYLFSCYYSALTCTVSLYNLLLQHLKVVSYPNESTVALALVHFVLVLHEYIRLWF